MFKIFLDRYASKENDTWVRSLVKDLAVEAGSGLVVLAPVDISGGYTSVKEKTNISITSTDICIHLSLSVASLLLKLQNEALAALQFGNVNPLASCTNFKQIWASPKGYDCFITCFHVFQFRKFRCTLRCYYICISFGCHALILH